MVKVVKHIKKPIKRKRKQPVRKPTITTNQPVPITTTNKSIVDPNTLRSMLLMRASTLPNAYDRISSMQMSKQKLIEQSKLQEQELEKYKQQLTKTKARTKDLMEEISEEERKQKQQALLLESTKKINLQYAKVNGENNIDRLIKEKLDAENALDEAKQENVTLNNQVKSQQIRNKIEQLEYERELIYAKNAAAQKYIDSIENQDPNEALKNKYYELYQVKAQERYFDKLIDLSNENIDVGLKKSAVEATANFHKTPLFKQTEQHIADLEANVAINQERTKQFDLLKKAREHNEQIRHTEEITEMMGMGDDEGTALAKQLTELEHQHDVIEERQKKLIDDYNEDLDEKISIYNEILKIEKEKVSTNPNETLQNYLDEVEKEWITDITDFKGNSKEVYWSVLNGYKKWHSNIIEEEESDDDTQYVINDTNNNDSNNNNETDNRWYVPENYGNGPDYSKDDFSYRRPSNEPIDPNWGGPP